MINKFEFLNQAERLEKVMQSFNPILMDEYKGMDISFLRDFRVEDPPSRIALKCFKVDKLDKIFLSYQDYMGQMVAIGCTIWPEDEYALPGFAADWNETPTHIYTNLDFKPLADCGCDLGYLKKYLDPLEPLWKKYKDTPGFEQHQWSWVRAMSSPYNIRRRARQELDNREKRSEMQIEYLKVYIELWKESTPQNLDYMKVLNKKKKVMRESYKDRDPLRGAMIKSFGTEIAERILMIAF